LKFNISFLNRRNCGRPVGATPCWTIAGDSTIRSSFVDGCVTFNGFHLAGAAVTFLYVSGLGDRCCCGIGRRTSDWWRGACLGTVSFAFLRICYVIGKVDDGRMCGACLATATIEVLVSSPRNHFPSLAKKERTKQDCDTAIKPPSSMPQFEDQTSYEKYDGKVNTCKRAGSFSAHD